MEEQLHFIKCEPDPGESSSFDTNVQKLVEVKDEPDHGVEEEHLAQETDLKTDVKIEAEVLESELFEAVARDEEEEVKFSSSVPSGELPDTSIKSSSHLSHALEKRN